MSNVTLKSLEEVKSQLAALTEKVDAIISQALGGGSSDPMACLRDTPIHDLDISVRAYRAMKDEAWMRNPTGGKYLEHVKKDACYTIGDFLDALLIQEREILDHMNSNRMLSDASRKMAHCLRNVGPRTAGEIADAIAQEYARYTA
jgi:hypothetical protein